MKKSGANSADAFFVRLNADASKILYSTYLGGSKPGVPSSNTSRGTSLAVDAQGNAHIAGLTYTTDFPLTPGAFSPPVPGGTTVIRRAFFARWSPLSGTFDYVGSVGYDVDPALQPSGSVYVAADPNGRTVLAGNNKANFIPVTPGALQPYISGPWVLKLNEIGSDLVYSTGLGTQPSQIRGLSVDGDGNPIVIGQTYAAPKVAATTGANRMSSPWAYSGFQSVTAETFVGKLNASGQRLLYLTYLDAQNPSGPFLLRGSDTVFVAGINYLPSPGPGIDIHAKVAAGTETPQDDRRSTLYAMPKVVDLCSRPSMTSLYWDTRDPAMEAVEVHAGATDGPLVASGLTGSIAVPPEDGVTYYLQDVSGGKPLIPENTLATEQISARRFEHCSAVAGSANAVTANPNPVLSCADDAGFTGTQTTLLVLRPQYWELHYGSPDGIQIAALSYTQTVYLGDWVRDSTDFFLTDGNGQPLASERVYILPIRWCRLGFPTPPVIGARCGPSGTSTLVWHAGVQPAEIRAGSPDGSVLARFDQSQGLFDVRPLGTETYHLMGYQGGQWRPLASVTVDGKGCEQ
jgi:hypothetical protein